MTDYCVMEEKARITGWRCESDSAWDRSVFIYIFMFFFKDHLLSDIYYQKKAFCWTGVRSTCARPYYKVEGQGYKCLEYWDILFIENGINGMAFWPLVSLLENNLWQEISHLELFWGSYGPIINVYHPISLISWDIKLGTNPPKEVMKPSTFEE